MRNAVSKPIGNKLPVQQHLKRTCPAISFDYNIFATFMQGNYSFSRQKAAVCVNVSRQLTHIFIGN